MLRRIALVVCAVVIATLAVGMGPAQAQGGAGCYLEGTATFKPGLTNDAQDFTYSFKGTLMGCMSNESDAPAGGTVSAGQVLPLKVKGQNMKFQEPVPSGNGSCGNGHTDGIAIVQWDGGAYSVVKYGTDSATGAVVLQGNPGVIPSVKLKAIKPKPGQPKSTTLKTTAYSGAGALGLLTFQPDDPTACGGDGVTSAAISGFTGYGNYQ